jgi:holo-[acyl-carrier protein] synthase
LKKGSFTPVTILVGMDFQEIDEVRESIENFGDRYVRRVYTDDEIEECCQNSFDSAPGLASRFAAKEAVFKVFKEGDVQATWREIEVRLECGRPTLFLRGAAATLAAQQGIVTMSLSMSQSRRTAAAVVVAECTLGSDR